MNRHESKRSANSKSRNEVYPMRPRIVTGMMLGALLAVPICRAQTAPDPLTQDDYKAIVNAGVPLDSKMVTELTPADRDRLKPIVEGKPAAEVKSFLVTRWFVRKQMASESIPDLDQTELALIQQNMDLQYCYDMREEMISYNAMLYYETKYGIEPARGLNLKDIK